VKGRVILGLLGVATAAIAGGCAESEELPQSAALSFDGAPQQSIATQSGKYRVEVWWSPATPRVGFNAAELVVSDARGVAMAGLDITAQAWMPSFDQGPSVVATVKEVEPGVYLAAPLDFFMPADWELRLRLRMGSWGRMQDDAAAPTVRVR
jgi:YtkA-like protein